MCKCGHTHQTTGHTSTPTARPWQADFHFEIFAHGEQNCLASVNPDHPNYKANLAHILKCVNNMPLTLKAFNDIISSKTLGEAKEYATKIMREMSKD